ncbi:hypothetical protein RchiOBHm_Chr0c40g0503361 [Rosa chinensis]|uniref:Uncharacterized protein n=1 Tax=Rosa chinensis TaxID=74649 RepID=A0A2P6SQ13_ROSCH|nr:hypothetical protein RchiOBHm_Chr4g0407311 [Rosa chinensis]PRQ60790.1 hypothetical protein RchiOBHm_Chr0c40g0503361 [Rosa chinensis]
MYSGLQISMSSNDMEELPSLGRLCVCSHWSRHLILCSLPMKVSVA